MNLHAPDSTADLTAKDWTARWVTSLTTPLYSVRMRKLIRTEMNLFAEQMPHFHAILVSRIVHDLISTIDPSDPLRNLHRDDQGVIRLPSGQEFGSWRNYTDLMPASHADIGRDISLAPAKEPLSRDAIEIFFHASHAWEDARDYVLDMIHRATTQQFNGDLFECVEDAVRWAMLRRQAYALDDMFFPITATGWSNHTPNIFNGQPFDEGRMLRLRSAASVPHGTYRLLTGSHLPFPCDEDGAHQ